VKYTSQLWQKLLQKVEQYLPIKFDYTGAGAVSHPWQITAQYYTDPENKSYWRATIAPGLVNGFPAKVGMKYMDAPPAAVERIRQDKLKNKKLTPQKKDRVEVYLDEQASITLSFRKIGTDANPLSITANPNTGKILGNFEKVPEFFKRLGVADAERDLFLKPAETKRLLRAGEIVLNQPRVGLTNNITFAAVGLESTLVNVNPGFSTPSDLEPNLIAVEKFEPRLEDPKTTFEDLFYMRFIDDISDQLHLSTVYLLSPLLPLEDPTNLAGWQPFIQYRCHHNLVHATKQIERRQEFKPLSLIVPLAGGVAQPIINYILAENNFFSQAALDFYQQRNLKGKFYAV
jgi:hypothetical protein